MNQTERRERALRLTDGWHRAEDELCTNRWFGDADALFDAAATATTATVRSRLGDGGLTVDDATARAAWPDPLTRADIIRDDDLQAPALLQLLEGAQSTIDRGGAFIRALRDDSTDPTPMLDPLLVASDRSTPRGGRFARTFERWVIPELSDGTVDYESADADFSTRLIANCRRTTAASPRLMESAWDFVSDVVPIAYPTEETLAGWEGSFPDSFSQPGLSGIVFFSRWILDRPWYGEITVLHEAVHQKLYTLLLTRPLFDDDRALPDAEVYVPWRDTHWPVRRAISACHAYVHMAIAAAALVARAAENGDPLHPDDGGDDDPLIITQLHIERMHYLTEQVSAFDRSVLAEAGLDLTRWLRTIALDFGRSADRPSPGLGVWP